MWNQWTAVVSATLLAVGVLGTPAPASAQQSDQPAGVERSTPTVERITVTARKREEDLQRTPLSLTALSGDQLETGGLAERREPLVQQVHPLEARPGLHEVAEEAIDLVAQGPYGERLEGREGGRILLSLHG